MTNKGKQCDSCNRDGGELRTLDGVVVTMCPDCYTSDFRRQRVLERARATEVTS